MKERTARKYNTFFMHGNGAHPFIKKSGSISNRLLNQTHVKYMTTLVKANQDITFEEIQRKIH